MPQSALKNNSFPNRKSTNELPNGKNNPIINIRTSKAAIIILKTSSSVKIPLFSALLVRFISLEI